MEPGGGKGHERVQIEKGEVDEAAVWSRQPTPV